MEEIQIERDVLSKDLEEAKVALNRAPEGSLLKEIRQRHINEILDKVVVNEGKRLSYEEASKDVLGQLKKDRAFEEDNIKILREEFNRTKNTKERKDSILDALQSAIDRSKDLDERIVYEKNNQRMKHATNMRNELDDDINIALDSNNVQQARKLLGMSTGLHTWEMQTMGNNPLHQVRYPCRRGCQSTFISEGNRTRHECSNMHKIM